MRASERRRRSHRCGGLDAFDIQSTFTTFFGIGWSGRKDEANNSTAASRVMRESNASGEGNNIDSGDEAIAEEARWFDAKARRMEEEAEVPRS